MTVNEEHLKLAEELPEEVRQNAIDLVTRMGQEIEGIGDEPISWSPSYLTLVQATTNTDNLPDGASPGSLVLDDEIFKKLDVIPLALWYQRAYWDPDHESNQMLCRSPDGNLGLINKLCKHCEFSSFNEDLGKSPCTLQINTLCMRTDLSDMFYVSFQKTNYKEGARWRGMLKKAAVPPWKRMYELVPQKDPKYNNARINSVQPLTGDEKYVPKEYFDFLNAVASQFREDRKNHLLDFENMVKEMTENNQLPQLESLSDEADTALEHQISGDDDGDKKQKKSKSKDADDESSSEETEDRYSL